MGKTVSMLTGTELYGCARQCGYEIAVGEYNETDRYLGEMIAKIQDLIADARSDTGRVVVNSPLSVRCERMRNAIEERALHDPKLTVNPLVKLAGAACLTRGFSTISKQSMEESSFLYGEAKRLRRKIPKKLRDPVQEAIWIEWRNRYRLCRSVFIRKCLWIRAANSIADIITGMITGI
ncbi:MAG: hypothetical protein IJW46_01270 [Clostridia bacterium]|nr:hypothetical protein [Clostridia bacterium]